MTDDTNTNTRLQNGTCYCGEVKVSISEPPALTSYCHCQSCRKWHAAPLTAFSMWPDAAIDIHGELITSVVNEESQRISCAKCGGAVATKKPKLSMTAIYPMIYQQSGANYPPQFHIFYAERVMDIADGLEKYTDVPSDLGGSGERIDEPTSTKWRMPSA